ncbi:hypothetical protein [Brevundimonas sp.]|uniref:hypothetical protein n=1 Tax=Brevundimonas sp. TaxID=1871086 RepID=UPI00179F35A6|nr:hypothetical protein [Brevundimonas sp.]MBA4805967.1 hypothetical protein [Brevundimonas sp.]
MNRLEPNILLAVSTGVALILLIVTASTFGEPGNMLKYVLSAAICTILFVALNGWLARLMKRPTPQPMINPTSPDTAVWAGLFPLLVMAAAVAPVFASGHDYGLLVIIASVLFGGTVDSAVRANRR